MFLMIAACIGIASLPDKIDNIQFSPTHMKTIKINDDGIGIKESVEEELDSCNILLYNEVLTIFMKGGRYEMPLRNKKTLRDKDGWVVTYRRKNGLTILDVYLRESRTIFKVDLIYPTGRRIIFYQKLIGT